MGENAQPYGIRADMWALGLSLFEIIIGTQPFLQMSIFQRTKTIRTWTPVWPSNRHISDDMKELVISLYVSLATVQNL